MWDEEAGRGPFRKDFPNSGGFPKNYFDASHNFEAELPIEGKKHTTELT
jgi:hypothetical protein